MSEKKKIITPNEKKVLGFIYQNPDCTLKQVQSGTELGKSSVSKATNNLYHKGLVSKKLYVDDHKVDGRAIKLVAKKNVKMETE
jgi:DNA-binding MarR family transcriptional regulator